MTRRVGMPRILKRAAVEPLASTSSLPTLTRPLYSSAIESMVGARARQGAHHAAQKSTSTGVLAFTTSDSKLVSVISTVFAPMKPPEKFYPSFWEARRAMSLDRLLSQRCRSSGRRSLQRDHPVHRRSSAQSSLSCVAGAASVVDRGHRDGCYR